MEHIRALTTVIEYEQRIFDNATKELESINQAIEVGAFVNDRKNRILKAFNDKKESEAVLILMKNRLKQYCE